MKLLVTGGLGHIGSHILQNVNKIKKIKKLYIIDNFLSNRVNSLYKLKKKKAKIFFIKKDLSTKDSLKNFTKVDIVLNLASITGAEKSLSIKKEFYRNNIGIFNNVVKYCKKNSAKLIHISSTSVYGRQNKKVDENCAHLKPQTPYAKIKLVEENILKKNSKKIKFVTFRFATIAGVSKGMRFHTAVNKFCWQAVMGQPLTIWKTAMDQKRPYLGVNDTVRAIKYIIEKDLFDGEIYNVVSSNNTVRNIVDSICETIPDVKVELVESEIMNQLSYHVFSDKIKYLQVVDNARRRTNSLFEMPGKSKMFYDSLDISTENMNFVNCETSQALLKTIHAFLTAEADCDGDRFKAIVIEAGYECGVKGNDLFSPVRIALYGDPKGPDIPLIFSILEKDETLIRLSQVIK